MLLSLHIENYALIDRLEVEFASGLNVLTGETGSGKSIVVDALGLLLGQRADAAAVRSGAERAWVGGAFQIDIGLVPAEVRDALDITAAEPVVVRREVGGRGRVLINDRPATVAGLRQLAPALGDVHAQNQALVAFTPAAQLELLDAYAGDGEELLPRLRAAFAAWRERRAQAAQWELDEQARLQQADLWRFQRQELQAAQLRAGEDTELEQERLRLANAERIAADAQTAYAALYDAPEAAATGIKLAQKHLQELARLDPRATDLVPRLASARTELEDIAASLRPWTEAQEDTAQRLAAVEERLILLDRMKRKYGPTLADAMALAEQLESRLDGVDNAQEHHARLRAEADAAERRYRELAAARSAQRRAAAASLGAAVTRQAADLAMKVQFSVEFAAALSGSEAWGPLGWDHLQFFATTNPGEPSKPVADIASGGELSRLLLALQVAIEGRPRDRPVSARTLVFDEIDAGIGGRAAEAVGRKLHQLGGRYQVLCVTHLAQIASFAGHHLRVEKARRGGRAVTEVAVLTGAQRVEEVARMLSGQASATARQHAAELLERAQSA